MSAEPLLRAALYVRVSTDEQTEFSLDAQKRVMTEYAKKNHMEIIPEYVFVEEGISAKRADKRPAFQQMIGIAKLKPKPFDVILVHKFDRFARNFEDSVVYKSMLKKICKIRVISITESLDGDPRMTMLIEAILDVMSEYYSINLAGEVKKGMTEKALRGELQTGAPMGYNASKTDNVLEINEQEAEYIRFIFKQFAENDIPISAIAEQLNNMGARTKRGNMIGRDNIMYVLYNPVYIGKLRWTPTERNERGMPRDDAIIVPAKHAPIISQELFGKAADKLAEMRRIAKPHSRPHAVYAHWLSGLMKCSNCGSSLTFKPHKSSPGFQCVGYYNSKCYVSHSISVKKAEAAILGELRAALEENSGLEFTVKSSVKRADATNDELAIKEKQLGSISSKLKRAKEAYLAEIDTLQEYKENKEKLEKEQARLTAEIELLKNLSPSQDTEVANVKFKSKVKGVVDIVTSDCDLVIKVKAIRSIIDKIIFDRPNKRIEVYYYDM